jgi:hypothetical protein
MQHNNLLRVSRERQADYYGIIESLTVCLFSLNNRCLTNNRCGGKGFGEVLPTIQALKNIYGSLSISFALQQFLALLFLKSALSVYMCYKLRSKFSEFSYSGLGTTFYYWTVHEQ